MPIAKNEVEIELDGRMYFVRRIGAIASFKMQSLLFPILLEVSTSFEQFTKLDLDANIKISDVLPALRGIFEKTDADTLWVLARGLLDTTAVVAGGSEVQFFQKGDEQFDRVMSGHTAHIWRLLVESVRLNYADFFQLLGAKKENASPAVTPSNASST
jgi:hypothetical protein